MEQDPLLSFLSNLSEKINVEKEHRAIMEGLEAPETVTPLAVTLANLQEKISKQVKAHLPPVEDEIVTPVTIIEQPKIVEDEEIEETLEEKDNFGDFLGRLKDILANPKEPVAPTVVAPIVEEIKEELPVEEPKAPIVSTPKNDYIQELERQSKPPVPKKTTEDYTSELDKISSKIANESEPAKIADIKKLLEEYAEKYLKKAAVMAEYAGGGGSNAVQYANGGTMNGDLNVTGQYLSGGVNLADIFTGGGGGGDPAVNALVHSNSGYWNSTYTTVSANSASWGTGGAAQTLSFDPNTANLSITNGNTVSLSSLSATGNTGNPAVNSLVISNSAYWNNSYTTLTANSASWQTTYTTVCSYSANWSNAYTNLVANSAAYLSGSDLSFLSVSSNWNSAYTNLTANSSNWQSTSVTVSSNSANWSNAYTNLVTNSAAYLSGYDLSFLSVSSNWNSSYTTLTANSSNWNTAYTLATGLTSLSSNWQNTYTTLYANSSTWVTYSNLNTGSFVPYSAINTLTGNWNTAYTLATGLTSLSSNWQSSYTTLYANSSTWVTYSNLNTASFVKYTDINTISGNWNTAYTLATGLTSLSSNWQSTYTTVNTNSANWNTAYTLATGLTSLSSNWQSSYTTLCANSGYWNTSYTLVQNNSASWNNALSSYAFIANGSVSIFNLSSTKPFTNAAGYIVSMNGAIQTPNTDFTITYSGTNYLNLNFTPRAGALIDVQVLGNGVITNSSVVTVSASTYNPIYTYVNSNFAINAPTGNYMVDTTTSGVTGTLPSSPTLGTVVEFIDPYYTWATNNFVLSAPTNIENQNQPVFMNIAGFDLKAVYVGGNYGWRLTQ